MSYFKTKGSLGLVAIAATMMISSCVSQKKYTAARDRAMRLHADSVNFYNQIVGLRGTVSKMEQENQMASSRLTKSKEELSQARQNLFSSNETIATQQARLEELQQLIEQQRQNSEALRKTIADALVNFNAEQLTVSLKNGKVYVSMSESLLFPSGSAVVNNDGKAALATLAKVLNQNPDINIDVEGHTDSIPIVKRYEDNWALSVARSTAITRILVKDYFVNPGRIIASGRSQYFPVAPNSTADGRARNRRTEIILEPKLDKIMQLVDAQAASSGKQ
jgi:chemotaxis protein MotB